MHLIGLDIGTTSCKAAVFSQQGILISSKGLEYGIDLPHPGWVEQDPERVWAQARTCLKEAIAQAGIHEVAALSLSCQGEAVIPLDIGGRVLRPAILGMDTRTDAQNEWLADTIGRDWLYEHTGMPVHTINTLPKLLWVKDHEPEVWGRTARFVLYEDFLIGRMTGEYALSRCMASRTQLYELQADRWSDEILHKLGLAEERLSRVLPSGTGVARMERSLADVLGLRNQPLVVTGGHDQACGALGVGLVRPGLAMVSTGTAEVVEVVLDKFRVNETLARGNISVYAHVVPELYLAMTLNHSGGLLLRWFRDEFCADERRRAAENGVEVYDLILGDGPPEPTGLLVLPHFAGSGTPWFDTSSRGAILGLTFATTRRDLARALLEGLTYELRINLDLLREGGIRIDELRAIGGGARSPLWLQMKADVTGIRVAVPEVTEAACRGAALLAGQGAGLFDAAEEAARTTSFAAQVAPQTAAFARPYELYRQLYPAVRDLHRQFQVL